MFFGHTSEGTFSHVVDRKFLHTYRIRPNYRTLRLHVGFSELLGRLVVKYVSTYIKGKLKQVSEGLIK